MKRSTIPTAVLLVATTALLAACGSDGGEFTACTRTVVSARKAAMSSTMCSRHAESVVTTSW